MKRIINSKGAVIFLFPTNIMINNEIFLVKHNRCFFFDLKKIYILFIVDYILVPKFVLVDSLKQLAYFC